MSELRAILVVTMILVVTDLVWLRRRRPGPRELLWLLFLTGIGAAGYEVFDHSPAFFPWLPLLFVINEVRLRFGLMHRDALTFEPYRYVPAMVVHVVTGSGEFGLWLALLLSLNGAVLRFILLALSRSSLPVGISPLDVDQIAPAPIRYRREEREDGFTMIEAIVGMTLIVTISSALFLAATGRAARLVQVREAAAAREAAVSVLERSGAWEFEELLAADGREFPVPGDGRPGRIEVEVLEPGLARVTVTAPRRGAVPLQLVTLRSRGEP